MKIFILFVFILIGCLLGNAQNINPLTGTTIVVGSNQLASDFGPRKFTGGTTFHRGIDLDRAIDDLGYAVEGGNLVSITRFGIPIDMSDASIVVGNWRYRHMKQSSTTGDNWEVISDGNDALNNDILIIRSNGAINVYSANPTGMYSKGIYPIGVNSYTIQRYIPAGSPIYKTGTFTVTNSSSGARSDNSHLHLESADNWTNPMTIIARSDAATANITLTNTFKTISTNSLGDFPVTNIIYSDVMLLSKCDSRTDHDFDVLKIATQAKGESSFIDFFSWRYSGTNHLDVTSTGVSTATPAYNVRLFPDGQTSTPFITELQANNDDVREGIYPLETSVYSVDLFKKKWETQTLNGTNPYDPKYPDTEYTIRFVASDLTNHNTQNDVIKVLDNYLPYISKVEVIHMNGAIEEIVYSRQWNWNGTSLVLGDITSMGCQDNVDLKLRLTASEPLSQINAKLNGSDLGPKTAGQSVDSKQKIWLFDVSNSLTQSGTNTIAISGLDLANNTIQTNPNILSRRNAAGVRPTGLQQGVDNNHSFPLVSSITIMPDFATVCVDPFNSKRIQFIDQSTPNYKINVREWNFNGEGSSSAVGPIFTFPSYGSKNVKLTVRESVGAAGFSKDRTVLVEAMAKPIPNFNVELRQEENDLAVLLHDATTGLAGNWVWTITNSVLKSTSTYYEQNPAGIILEKGVYYDVKLQVSNETGTYSATKTKCIYYEEGVSPDLSIYVTKEEGQSFSFNIMAMNFGGTDITYEVDFGDGTVMTYPYSFKCIDISHFYQNGGNYKLKVFAKGRDLYTGAECTVFKTYNIDASYNDLDVVLNVSSPSGRLTWDPITFSGVNTNRNEESYITYWWTIFKGTEIDQNSQPIDIVYGTAKKGVPIGNFTHTFTEPGNYVVNLNVTNDRQRMGNARQVITIEEKPVPIEVLFKLPEKYKNGICENSSAYFEGSVYNEHTQNRDEYPTTMRWTLFRNGNIVAGFPIVVKASTDPMYSSFAMNGGQKFSFGSAGKYIIRLEGWCNKKMSDSDAKPENNNTQGYYDVKELEVIVSSNLSALVLSNIPTSDIKCVDNSFAINVTNPGKKIMNWSVAADSKCSSWLSISSGCTGTNNGTFTVHCNANTSPYNRNAEIVVTADGAQDSPQTLRFMQLGAAGAPEQMITDPSGNSGDQFGYSVAVCGEYAVVGAPYSDANGKNDCGSFSLFRKINGEWKVISKTNGMESGGNLGFAVDITKDYIVVGEPGYNGATIFRYNSLGVYDKYPLTFPGSRFGSAVAIDGDICLIGSETGNINGLANSGNVVIYSRFINRPYSPPNAWGPAIVLWGRSANDRFGCSVDVSGDLAIIGASGGRYCKIFSRKGGEFNWVEEAEIKKLTSYNFGKSVSIFNRNVVVGFENYPNGVGGQVNLYTSTVEGQWNYSLGSWLVEGFTDYGKDISLYGNQWLVGSPSNSTNLGRTGNAWKEKGNNSYTRYPEETYINGDWGWLYPLSDGDRFGFSVKIDAQNCIVGAPGENNNRGMVYINNYNKIIDYCGTSLNLQNFTKYEGQYADVKAVSIVLGEGGGDATIKSGASIKYIGERIALKSRVRIEKGARVAFKSESLCSKSTLKSLAADESPNSLASNHLSEYMNDSEKDFVQENGSIALMLIKSEERVLKFRFKEKVNSSVSVDVINSNGENVFHINNSSELEFNVDFAQLPDGIYTIKALRNGKKFERQVIIR